MLRHDPQQKQTESGITHISRKWNQTQDAKEHEANTVLPPDNADQAAQQEIDPLPLRSRALQQALRRRMRSRRVSQLGAGLAASGLAWTLVYLSTLGRTLPTLPGLFLFVAGYVLLITGLLRDETALRAAVSGLAGVDDLRAVGPLTEVLEQNGPSYTLAVAALSRLLPRLQPLDGALLTPSQRACLRRAFKRCSNRMIFWRYNPRFAATICRALETLGELPPTESATQAASTGTSDVEALLAQFQMAVRQRRKNTITMGIGAATAAFSALLNAFLPLLTHEQSSSYLLLGVSVVSLAVTLTLSLGGVLRLNALMNELAEAGDLRLIGPLIEMVTIQDSGGAYAAATFLLTRLLPQLKSSDADLLSEGQHACLGRALRRNLTNADFLVAALKALEQVGNAGSLSIVESLATGKVKTADPQRVRAAAQDCLPFLRMRADQQRANQTLLRASGVSAVPTDILLRPAEGGAPEKEADLLRPGTPRPLHNGEDEAGAADTYAVALAAC